MGFGQIDEAEFLKAMRQLGLGLQDEELHEIVEFMDVNGDGEIDYPEFAALFGDGGSRGEDQAVSPLPHSVAKDGTMFNREGRRVETAASTSATPTDSAEAAAGVGLAYSPATLAELELSTVDHERIHEELASLQPHPPAKLDAEEPEPEP